MKSKRLWGKLKSLLMEEQQYQPEIPEVQIFQKQLTDDIIIYDVDGMIIKQSNKQLQPEKKQLSKINSNSIDNTGAFYWPSEQILAKYLLEHLEILEGTKIIELGAGRSGFCGLVLSKKGFQVTLTDGNTEIIQELEANVKLNNANISVELLQWQQGEQYKNSTAIISDCFFFEKYHDDLVHTIKRFKRAFGAAPSRGGSLERFIEKCRLSNIECKQMDSFGETKIILFNNQ